jgi:hypothetical protein
MVEIWGEYALHFKSNLAMAAHVVNPSHHDANQQASGSAMNAFYRICRRFFHGDDDIDNTPAIISLQLTAYWNKSAASFSQDALEKTWMQLLVICGGSGMGRARISCAVCRWGFFRS